jgi:tetratricopeptide (TPR) repeat protein
MSFSKEERVIPNEHLSFDQIREAAGADPSSLPPAASAHLGDCRQCAELVKFVNGLGAVKPDLATDLGDCPSQIVLLEIAEGLTVPDTSLYRHITQCHRCVTTLREFSEDLKDENLPHTKDLRTASPGWQRALAGKIASSAGTTFPEPRRLKLPWIQFGQKARWVYAATIAIVFGLGVVSWFVWRSRPAYADRLLAQAYTAQRTMEMRISGARYAPLRVQRGISRLDRPLSLLEAEEVIARKLAEHPSDPNWLQANARAQLLEGNYESSIKALEGALGVRPGSPELLVDLASAYVQRAEVADRPIDYEKAIDVLGRALSKRPDDAVALFNRAIALEKMYLYTQAVEDWEHYLRVDPSGDWANEARHRLDDLRLKLKKHAESSPEPCAGSFSCKVYQSWSTSSAVPQSRGLAPPTYLLSASAR